MKTIRELTDVDLCKIISDAVHASASSSSGIRKLAEDRRSEFELLTKDWQERAK